MCVMFVCVLSDWRIGKQVMCWKILKFLYSVKAGTKRRKEINFNKFI